MLEASKVLRLLTAKFTLLVPLIVVSQAAASPLFETDATLEVSLAGPLHTLIAAREDRTELPFVLRVDGVEHDISVRVRGKSRAKLCRFPPLRLDFSADATEGSVFAGQDKLRLVTHCRFSDAAQADALEEYAAYRIFNLLSDVGYKVRLLHIAYTDTDGRLRNTSFDRYGFLIESSAEMSARVGGERIHVGGVALGSLNDRHAALVYVFQYLIANTDWSLVKADGEESCCHNGNIFDIGDELFYVPYDFDLAGLVNARYARPDPSLRISRVTQRKYRGFCMAREGLVDALNDIRAKKAEILEVLRTVPGLSAKDIKKDVRFIEKFFARAEDPEKLVRRFEDACL